MIEHANYQQQKEVRLGTGEMTIEDVVGVARLGWSVAEFGKADGQINTPCSYLRAKNSREWIEAVVQENYILGEKDEQAVPYYGINTGYGAKVERIGLSRDDIAWVSRNLIVSHSTGVGDHLHPELVRATILLRANSLAQGYSGVRIELINTLVRMLNLGVTPVVPEYGSVGASGDLVPLSHIAAVLSKRPPGQLPLEKNVDDYDESGQAYVDLRFYSGERKFDQILTIDGRSYALMSGHQAMRVCGIEPLVLEAKEGLALNNGATVSAAIAALAVYDAENLSRHAEIGAALTMEALLGFRDAFFPQVQRVRHHEGQKGVAERILKITRDSQLLDGDEYTDPRYSPPQDAYAIRVTPQVLGAVWDTLKFVRGTITDEINAATDNPLIFNLPEDDPNYLPRAYRAVSGGNFHGAPLAYAMDFLSIVITDLGSLSERRVFRLNDKNLNYGLPSCLVADEAGKPGVTSGVMLAQYLAAGLVSDCKTLAHPDSVDSIPTSANQEDHVSMSLNAARHARKIVENIGYVVAVELLSGYLALKYRIDSLQQNSKPVDKPPAERTRQEEKLLWLWENLSEGQSVPMPQPGVGSQAALSLIAQTLYPTDQALPLLGERPTLEDRYLQPYILRIVELLKEGSLVDRVYEEVRITN